MVYFGSCLDAWGGLCEIHWYHEGIYFEFVREGRVEGIGLGKCFVSSTLIVMREVDCATDYIHIHPLVARRYSGTSVRKTEAHGSSRKLSHNSHRPSARILIPWQSRNTLSRSPPVISTLDLSESWRGISSLPSSFKSARRGSGEWRGYSGRSHAVTMMRCN